jgi:Arc/MetJ-type ribon-helix-helix transcriptional regulator
MTSPHRSSKTPSGYRIPPDIERAMDELIETGEFCNRADIITAALRFWLSHRDLNINEVFETFLLSERGQELILEIVKNGKKRKKV